jgi:hypothetical protein
MDPIQVADTSPTGEGAEKSFLNYVLGRGRVTDYEIRKPAETRIVGSEKGDEDRQDLTLTVRSLTVHRHCDIVRR